MVWLKHIAWAVDRSYFHNLGSTVGRDFSLQEYSHGHSLYHKEQKQQYVLKMFVSNICLSTCEFLKYAILSFKDLLDILC